MQEPDLAHSSDEEDSLARRWRTFNEQRPPKQPLHYYNSFVLACITLSVGLVLATAAFCSSWLIKMLPTNVYLYEHRQLFDDWRSLPLIDVVIRDGEQGCPAEYEPLFSRTWNGTYDLCFDKSG